MSQIAAHPTHRMDAEYWLNQQGGRETMQVRVWMLFIDGELTSHASQSEAEDEVRDVFGKETDHLGAAWKDLSGEELSDAVMDATVSTYILEYGYVTNPEVISHA